MDRFVISLIVIIGGITCFVLYQIEETVCLPNDMSRLKLEFQQSHLEFPPKLPTALPLGYSLQGNEAYYLPGAFISRFYYGTHPICTDPPYLYFQRETPMILVSIGKENYFQNSIYSQNGSKVIAYGGTTLSPMTSFEFQQGLVKYNENKNWKAVDINSFKGAFSDSHPRGVMFLNDNDQVVYGIYGSNDLTLDQLLAVARSIPP